MKTLICITLSLLMTVSAYASTCTQTGPTRTVTKTKVTYKTVYSCQKPCKKIARKHSYSRKLYASAHCEYRRSRDYPCACQQYCYPAHVYQCRTELNYRHGRNHAIVEVCN